MDSECFILISLQTVRLLSSRWLYTPTPASQLSTKGLSVSSITSRRRAGATIFSCGYNKSTTAGMMQRGRMYFNLLFTEQRHRLEGFIESDLCARSYSPAIKGRRKRFQRPSNLGSPHWTISQLFLDHNHRCAQYVPAIARSDLNLPLTPSCEHSRVSPTSAACIRGSP